MFQTRKLSSRLCGSACVAMAASVMAPAASAKEFQFTYTGAFNTLDALNLQGATTADFTAETPFTATALFDDSSPNIVAPVGVSGFVAYSPISATLTVNGKTYDLATYDQNQAQGVTVALFDDTTPFANPGTKRYAAGFLQNPLADGAGFIGDWNTATPTFSAANLVPTTFTGYNGVGYQAGPNQGTTVVPIPLTDSMGNSYLLTLGNYDENFVPGAQGGPLNTANLAAVPEPAPVGLLALGLGILAVTRRPRARAGRAKGE